MFSKILLRIRHPLLANSFYLYLSHFSDYLLSLFILPFIARNLGAEELGRVGLAQTFGVFIVLFIEFGSPLMATRRVAILKKNRKKLKLFISQVFTFKILLIPLAILISIITIQSIPVFYLKPHYIIIVTTGGILQGLSPSWYFQGIEKMKTIALSKTVFRILGFIIIIIFVRSPQDGWIALVASSFSSICICFYLFYQMINKLGTFSVSNLYSGLNIFVKSKYSFFITILPALYQNLGLMLLSFFTSPIQLGFYYGIARIYRAFNTLYGPIGQVFFPRLSSINNETPYRTKKMIINFFWIMIIIGIFFSASIFLFSKEMIILLLGESFLPANNILKLFGIVLPLTAISHVLGRQWLMIIGRDSYYFITLLIASIFGISTILILITDFNVFSIPISLIIFELITIAMILVYFLIKK